MNKALEVEPASLIPAVELEQPANAALLVAGAASDFDCAFNSYAAVGALITGEFVDALQTADRWPYNQRTVASGQGRYSTNSCTGLGMYQPLQASRVSASARTLGNCIPICADPRAAASRTWSMICRKIGVGLPGEIAISKATVLIKIVQMVQRVKHKT